MGWMKLQVAAEEYDIVQHCIPSSAHQQYKKKQPLSSSSPSNLIAFNHKQFAWGTKLMVFSINMDVDFWPSRVHPVKHHHSVARVTTADSRAIMDDGDDDMRAWFPCPFCYVEIDIPVFCSHLQEDHCFDLKHAVCPICAASLGKDALGHFMIQHAHSVKRRKSQKSGFWNNSSAMIGKDFRDLTTFLGTHSLSNKSNEHEPVADPLISPFICPLLYDSNDQQPSATATLTTDEPSNISPSLDPIQERKYRERRERAAFLQELIFSTIF